MATKMGPAVKIAEQFAQTLNSNSQHSVTATNPMYSKTLGDKNFYKAQVRLGPDALYAHIMKAAFDPVYGREFSLAREEEVKPATRFPLIESDRPHERSELQHAPQKAYQLFKKDKKQPETTPIPGPKRKQDNPYHSYSEGYGKGKYKTNSYIPSKGKESGDYKVVSLVKTLEKNAKKYSQKQYVPEKANTEAEEKGLYENNGVAAKVSYLVQKSKGYVGKKGYSISEGKGTKGYEGINPQNVVYILPLSYAVEGHGIPDTKPKDFLVPEELELKVTNKVVPLSIKQKPKSIDEAVELLAA
jgi:hypothetical protein